MGLVNERLRAFVHLVGIASSLEKKFRWIAFPGLIRGIGIIHFFVFVLILFNPDTLNLFRFNREAMAEGEYWRVISFIAIPPITPVGMPLLMTLFMFFLLKITFLINDSLEHAWGEFRTSLYVYATLACMILANFLQGPFFFGGHGGLILYQAVFIAFATLFPNIEFRLFLILPVKIGVLAIILGVITLLQCFRGWDITAHTALTFLPYLVWAVPRFGKWYAVRGKVSARRAAFQKDSASGSKTFHECAQCGATEASHPGREFRVTADGRELCDACLPEKQADTGK